MAEIQDTGSDELRRAAHAWLVKLDAGTLGAADRAAFDAWIAVPQHQKAFEQARLLWDEVGRLPRPAAVAAPAFWRSAVPAAVALAAVLAVAIFVFDIPMRLQSDALTGIGESQTLTFADGTVAQLNTASALAVHYTSAERRVALLRGEASFTVARDTSRPFIVEAGNGRVTALGTEFIVRLDGKEARVTDVESRVEVASAGDFSDRVILNPGEQVRYAANGVGPVIKVDTEMEGAWRRGKLVFVDRPLGKVIEEINRYHRGSIRVVDPAIYERRVSGVFDLGDPLAVVDTLEKSLGFRSIHLTGFLVLLYR